MIWPRCVFVKRTVITSPASRSSVAVLPLVVLPLSMSPLTTCTLVKSQLAKAGWDLTNVQVVSGDIDNGSTTSGSTATLDLDAGEVITVRFTNTQRGQIIVEKQTNPDGSVETFEFDPSY